MNVLWVIVIVLAICPLLWLVAEFQPRIWLRIVLGLGGMAGVFVVSNLLTISRQFEANSYYGFTSKELIESTIDALKNGQSEEVLNELRKLNEEYSPTYENKANYQELVRVLQKTTRTNARMSSIDQLFAKLRSENRKALMPFVTAGDPDLEFTAAVLQELVERGAPHVRGRHSLQRSDRRRAGDSGVVHAGAREEDQAAPTFWRCSARRRRRSRRRS